MSLERKTQAPPILAESARSGKTTQSVAPVLLRLGHCFHYDLPQKLVGSIAHHSRRPSDNFWRVSRWGLVSRGDESLMFVSA